MFGKIMGALAAGMGVIGSALALPRDTVPNSVLESVTEVTLPGDLTVTPSMAAFLNDNWHGLSAYAISQAQSTEVHQLLQQVVFDNGTAIIGHAAAAVSLIPK